MQSSVVTAFQTGAWTVTGAKVLGQERAGVLQGHRKTSVVEVPCDEVSQRRSRPAHICPLLDT